MASIEVKGYVNKPASFGDGKYSRFTLAERQRHGKDKEPVKVFYDVTDWQHSEAPKESSFVTVKGFLNIEKVEKDGKTYTNLKINAQSIDVAEQRANDGGNKGDGKKPAPAAEDYNDLPDF